LGELTGRPSSQKNCAIGLLAVAAAALVAYGSVVTFGFVYDDHWTLVDNRALEKPLAPLLRLLVTGQAALRHVPDATRPVMVVSMWLDRHAFGSAPFFYHVHSLALYVVASAGAAFCAFAVSRRRWTAVFAGVLFAVFPVHAEVVAAVNYREDLYAAIAIFYALAWLFWPRPVHDTAEHGAWISLLLLLGLLGKESTVAVVPLALVAAAVTRRGVVAWSFLRARRATLLGSAVTLASWGTYRAWLHAVGRDDVPLTLEHRTIADKVFRACRYLTRSTLEGVFPVSWSPDYAPLPPASALWSIPCLGVIALVVLLSRRRSFRTIAVGVAVACVAGLPTSPLVSPINEVADRYVFVASLGGAIAWGAALDRARAALATRRFAPWMMLAIIAAPLVALSWRAAAPWKSDVALWETAIERAPDSWRAWTAWSRILRLRGDLDGADRAVETAISVGPTAFRPRVTQVYNLLARGKVSEAKVAIDAIKRRGGAGQAGMRRAASCAELSQAEAALCIDEPVRRSGEARSVTPAVDRSSEPAPD
jgi:hypothetical protein